MKSPLGIASAILGTWCWFVSTTALAAPASSRLQDGEEQPTAPAAETSHLSDYQGEGATCNECVADSFCYRWEAWANAMAITRTGGDDISLAFGDPNQPKGSEIFGTQDIDFGFAWGPHVGLYRCLDDCRSVGVEFFAVDGWTTENQVAGNISVQFPSFPYLPDLVNPNDPNSGFGIATFRYESNLYNTEVNFRRRAGGYDWFTALAGFRWIEVSEQFGTVFQTGGTTPHYSIDSNNHLYGFQIGGLVNLRSYGPWFFEGWTKAGIYANSSSQATQEDFTSAGGVPTFVSASDTNAAFAGDIGLSVGWNLTERLAAKIGYSAMWIEGVALAPDQLDNVDPSIGYASVDNSGGVFYHGGFVGFDYLW